MNYPSGYQTPPDPPREVWPYVCDVCGEECNADEIECYGTDIVCHDCEGQYLRDHGEEYVGEYVAQAGLDYYRDWWLGGMEPEERDDQLLHLLQFKYAVEEFLNLLRQDHRLEENRRQFCEQDDLFPEFVARKLKEELNCG